MRGFRKLVLLGVFLVTLLVVSDIIDAGKKEPKKREIDNGKVNEKENTKSEKYEKLKKLETSKPEKAKKTKPEKSGEGETKEDPKLETKKYKVKKGTKYTTTDRKTVEEGVNPKITKTYQKVKKYKIVEDETSKPLGSNKLKDKKTKSQKEETVDEVYKSVKKTSQKMLPKEKDNIIDEELLSRLYEESNGIIDEEENNGKRKKYKLVEVVLEEDAAEEEKEANETFIEVGSEDDRPSGVQTTESEEVIERFKKTQTVKVPRTKKPAKSSILPDEDPSEESLVNTEETLESGFEEDSSSNIESYESRYEESNTGQSCNSNSDDKTRQGPKKLTLFVVEEEVDGQLKKRVISEEDGVTMCEVADLLKEQYYVGLP